MRISSAIPAASLIALSLAAHPSSTLIEAPKTTSTALTPTQSCLAACNPADVTCQAICLGTAHPTTADVNATNQCVARCPQGDGSAAESLKFAQCEQACIAANFPTTGTGVPVVGENTVSGMIPATATAGSGAGATGASSPSASASSGGTGSQVSQTGSAAASTSTAAATSNMKTGFSVAGFTGLLMALFAL